MPPCIQPTLGKASLVERQIPLGTVLPLGGAGGREMAEGSQSFQVVKETQCLLLQVGAGGQLGDSVSTKTRYSNLSIKPQSLQAPGDNPPIQALMSPGIQSSGEKSTMLYWDIQHGLTGHLPSPPCPQGSFLAFVGPSFQEEKELSHSETSLPEYQLAPAQRPVAPVARACDRGPAPGKHHLPAACFTLARLN